jgi:hypothetical protein
MCEDEDEDADAYGKLQDGCLGGVVKKPVFFVSALTVDALNTIVVDMLFLYIRYIF